MYVFECSQVNIRCAAKQETMYARIVIQGFVEKFSHFWFCWEFARKMELRLNFHSLKSVFFSQNFFQFKKNPISIKTEKKSSLTYFFLRSSSVVIHTCIENTIAKEIEHND